MKYCFLCIFYFNAFVTTFSQKIKSTTDSTSPTISCKENIKAVTYFGSLNFYSWHAANGYFDNETEDENLVFTFNHQYPIDSLLHLQHFFIDGKLATDKEYKDGMAYEWDPKSNNTSIKIIHSNKRDTIIKLDVTVFDEVKNFSSCRAIVKVIYDPSKKPKNE